MNEIELKARELLAEMARGFGQPEYAYHIGCGGVLDKGDRKLIGPLIAALAPQWQPIESAPKDGDILAWDGCDTRVTHWHTRPSGAGGWLEQIDQYEVIFWQPTHWQPIPARPEVL